MPGALMTSVLDGANGRLRVDDIDAPIVRAIEHILLNTFANDAWLRRILRAHIHGEIARETSTVSIESGCGAKVCL